MSTQTALRDPVAAAVPGRRSLLRTALALDAVVTGANGAAYLVAAEPIGDLLGLAPALLRGAGAFLVAFAAVVAVTARRPAIRRGPVLGVVAVNAVWAAGSVVAAAAGWGTPESAGTVWIVLQAVTVGAFAELQVAGLRRQGRTRGD